MPHDSGDKPPKHGPRFTTRQWLFLALAIVLAVFFVLNLQKVEVDLIVATVELPLVIALGISAVLGSLLTLVLRHRRSDS